MAYLPTRVFWETCFSTSYPCGCLRDSRFCNLIARPDNHRTDDHFGFDFWDGHSWRPFVTYFPVTFKGPFEIMGGNDSGTQWYYLDRNRQIQHTGSVPSHSGGQKVNLRLQTILFPNRWSDYSHHAGSSHDYRSICEGGLIAEGIGVREGRRICFVTAVDPWQHRCLLLDTNRTNRERFHTS